MKRPPKRKKYPDGGKILSPKQQAQAYSDSLAVYNHSIDPYGTSVDKANSAYGRLHALNKEAPVPVGTTMVKNPSTGKMESTPVYKKPTPPPVITSTSKAPVKPKLIASETAGFVTTNPELTMPVAKPLERKKVSILSGQGSSEGIVFDEKGHGTTWLYQDEIKTNTNPLTAEQKAYQAMTAEEKKAWNQAHGRGYGAPVLGKKKKNGGIIGKYEDGGTVQDEEETPKEDKLNNPYTGSALQQAGQIGSGIVTYLDQKDGRGSIAGGTGAGMLAGAGQGAAIGSMIPGVGTVVGAGIGAALGGIKGAVDAKKERDARIEQARNEGIEAALNNRTELNYTGKSSIDVSKDQKRTLGIRGLFAKGGKIEGPGGPKEDKIKAELPSDSFIVPAENAKKAMAIREKYLSGFAHQKAPLKQGGTPVKVSDGEHMFTEEEFDFLQSKGVDLWELAPNADTNPHYINRGGKVPCYQDGGKIEEMTPEEKERVRNHIKAKKDKEERLKTAKKLLANPNRKPEEIEKIKKEVEKTESELAELNKAKSISDILKKSTVKTGKPATGSSLKKKLIEKAAFSVKEIKSPVAGEDDVTILEEKPVVKTALPENEEAKKIQASLTKYEEEKNKIPSPVKSGNGIRGMFDMGNAEKILAISQAGLGLTQLLKDGKRPVDQIDPTFDRQVNKALSDSSYGLNPLEKAQVEKSILQNRAADFTNIKSLSGGNAGVALGNQRAAINRANEAMTGLAIEDQRARMEKERYANSLVSQRAEMRRRLFADKMAAFQQNQEAGGALLSSGISNYLGSLRYDKEMKNQKEVENIRKGYLGTVPK